jgi:hypothetical protein
MNTIVIFIFIILLLILIIFLKINGRIDKIKSRFETLSLGISRFKRPTDSFNQVMKIYSSQTNNSNGIFSYSLYGNYKKYLPGLLKNIKRAEEYFPDWESRIYLSCDIPESIINEILFEKNSTIYVMGPNLADGHHGMVWRFLPAAEKTPFISMDADDIFELKMVKTIKRWLNSNLPFFSYNYVSDHVLLLGRNWGSRNCSLPQIRSLINQHHSRLYGVDELILWEYIWPEFKKNGYYTEFRIQEQLIGYFLLNLHRKFLKC